MSASGLFALLSLAGGVFAAGWLAVLVARWPSIGFASIGVHILALWEYPTLPPVATVAGATIYPTDVLAGAFLTIAAMRARAVGAARPSQLLMAVGVLALLGLNILRGITAFGLGPTINEARPIVLIVAAMAWVWSQSADPKFALRIHRFMTWTGLGLVAVSLWHISQRGLGTAEGLLLVDGSYFTTRPLISTQACFLALTGLYLVVTRRRQLLGVVFLVFVLLMQHRSVWLATAAGLLVVLMRTTPRIRANVTIALVVAAVVGGILVVGGAFPSVLADLRGSAQSTATLDDRTEGWTALVGQANGQGPFTILLGQPFGTGWDRIDSAGRLVTIGPHNWYVTLYLRLGLLGVAAALVMLASAAKRLRRDSRAVELVWLITLGTYMLPYNLEPSLAPFLAIALARVPMLSKKSPVPESTASAPRPRRPHLVQPRASSFP